MRDLLTLLESVESDIDDPKLREIGTDAQNHEIPPSVVDRMILVLKNLLKTSSPKDDIDQQLLAAETEPEEELEEGTDPSTGKWAIGAKDQVLYELLKQTNPENADKVWAYYNKAMLEEFLIPMLNAKDINKPDDHARVINLFISASGSLEDKVALASKLTDGGVINIKKLITAGSGSIDELINYKNPVLDEIKHQMISFKVSPSTTAVNTGDGEAFFLILGNGVSKMGAGDLNVKTKEEVGKLNILGREVEVKAQGARLKGFGGKGVYGDGAAYYKEFNLDLLNIIGPTGAEELEQATGFSLKSPFNLGAANTNALSAVLARYGKGKAAEVKKMFDNALAFIYSKSTPNMRKLVTKTIKSSGSFDPAEFRKGWFLLTYEYYMETSKKDGHGGYDGILFIHQPSFTYKYVKSADEISEDWDQFELNPGLYNWTDAPSVAPKITFGKEIRIKKSTAKAAPKKVIAKHVDIRPTGAKKSTVPSKTREKR